MHGFQLRERHQFFEGFFLAQAGILLPRKTEARKVLG